MLPWIIFVFIVAATKSSFAFPQSEVPLSPNSVASSSQNSGSVEVDGFIFDGPADRPNSKPLQSSTNFPLRTTPPTTTGVTTTTTTTTVSTLQFDSCVASCPVTNEYNPVCGTDNIDYNNPGSLGCSISCGKAVSLNHYGRCVGSSLIRG